MEASAMMGFCSVWAYVDPVTVLPVTSIIATVVGVFLFCGKTAWRSVVGWARFAMYKVVAVKTPSGAHFEHQRRESKAVTVRDDGSERK
jgi:hypothetical protein